jgi:NADH-quinone oxidoreductase subunit M
MSHFGLMCAALFAGTLTARCTRRCARRADDLPFYRGAVSQRTGSTDFSSMGGLKTRMPRLHCFMFVTANAIALPLTQSFVGEWLIYNGLWQWNNWTAFAGVVLIVLGAIYMLYAYQRVMLGPDREIDVTDADDEEHFFLVPLIAITLLLGVFPNVILHLVDGPVQQVLNSFTSLP